MAAGHHKSPSSLPVPPPETPRAVGGDDSGGGNGVGSAASFNFAHETDGAAVTAASSSPPPTPPRGQSDANCSSQKSVASPSRSPASTSKGVRGSPSGGGGGAGGGGAAGGASAAGAAGAAAAASFDQDKDVPTPPLKTYSSRQQMQQQFSSQRGNGVTDKRGRSSKAGGAGGAGGSGHESPTTGFANEDAMESDLDFIRELTRCRGGAARASRNDE